MVRNRKGLCAVNRKRCAFSGDVGRELSLGPLKGVEGY